MTLVEDGLALYESHLRSALESEHFGEFVAIEPSSACHFLGQTATDALVAARNAMPKSQFFLTRIGRSSAHKIAGVAHVLSEAQRRYAAFLMRRLVALPGDAVMSRARKSLKRLPRV